MKILVTNDDGIDSPGIEALAEAMSRVGEVLIVAPDNEQSGVGTAVSFHNGIAAAERTSTIEGARTYAVSGTPSDCVFLGLGPLAEGNIDLVVSGINTGANVGNAVLGSGTTMATRVAHTRSPRIPSIAVSVSAHGPQDCREPHFYLAATVSELLARRIAEGVMPPGVTLNVNVPSVPRGEIRGIAVTRLSPISYWRLRTEQGGDGLYYHKLSAVAADHPDIVEGTDVWALNRGLISITPLRLEVTDDTQLPALREHTPHLESALGRVVVEVSQSPWLRSATGSSSARRKPICSAAGR